MQVNIEKGENSTKNINIVFSQKESNKYKKHIINHLKEHSKIKGFRSGSSIPDDVIIKQRGIENIENMALDDALSHNYNKILQDHKIIPIGQANIVDIKSRFPMDVTLSVEVYPEITLDPKYRDIKIEKTSYEVTKEDIDNYLDDIQSRFTTYKSRTKAYSIKSGDKAYINTRGLDKQGNLLENTTMENYPLIIGSGIMVAGFEDGLLGRKIGENINIDIKFPSDYHQEDFRDKETVFEIDILNVESPEKPEFTPEFIKDFRGKDQDLESFREDIKKEMEEQKADEARISDEKTLIGELEKYATIEYGNNLLENQVNIVFDEIKRNIENSGADPSEYIESIGMSEESYIEQNVKPTAIQRLRAELILNEIMKIEEVKTPNEEVDKEVEKILQNFKSKDAIDRIEEVYKPGSRQYEDLRVRLGYRNIINSFFK